MTGLYSNIKRLCRQQGMTVFDVEKAAGLGGNTITTQGKGKNMNTKRENTISPENRILVDESALRDLLSAGRDSALLIGEAAGARVRVGRSVLWNVQKVRDFLNTSGEVVL